MTDLDPTERWAERLKERSLASLEASHAMLLERRSQIPSHVHESDRIKKIYLNVALRIKNQITEKRAARHWMRVAAATSLRSKNGSL